MGKYKSKFNGQEIDNGIEYGVRVTQQTFSSAQKQQARGNIAAQETLVVGTNLDDTPTVNSTNPVTSGGVKTSFDGKEGIIGKGTCSTAAATAAKEVTVSNKFTLSEGALLVVKFTNGISVANATLSVNSGTAKPIYYRGAPIIAGLIEENDIVWLKYNGSQFEIIGGNLYEEVIVTATTYNGVSVSGKKITIGGVEHTLNSIGQCTAKVPYGKSYSIIPEGWRGYLRPVTQHFTASQSSRSVSVQWGELPLGVFIEDIDHNLYTSAQWPSVSSTKTPNAVCLFTSEHQYRIGLIEYAGISTARNTAVDTVLTAIGVNWNDARADFDGEEHTALLMQFADINTPNSGCYNIVHYTFADGEGGCYVGSAGEINLIYQNRTDIDACLTLLNVTVYEKTSAAVGDISSTYWGLGKDYTGAAQEGDRYMVICTTNPSMQVNGLLAGNLITVSYNKPIAKYK